MIYPKASAKLKIKPWVQQNSKKNFNLNQVNFLFLMHSLLKVSQLVYFAREGPVVFYSTLIAIAVGIPTFAYLIKSVRDEPKGTAHKKVYYSVVRPEDYPKELHKYCR